MIPDSKTTNTFVLADGDHHVQLRKFLTPNGERLVIESDGASVRLDALALESLSWQDSAFFEKLTGRDHAVDFEISVDGEPTMQIGNEYTTIKIRCHDMASSPMVSLRSPKLEYHCVLDAAELGAIAHQNPAFFSDLLATPLGPEDEHTHIL